MTVPRLSPEQRRALEILADAGINGTSEATLLAHGFTRAVLAVLCGRGWQGIGGRLSWRAVKRSRSTASGL